MVSRKDVFMWRDGFFDTWKEKRRSRRREALANGVRFWAGIPFYTARDLDKAIAEAKKDPVLSGYEALGKLGAVADELRAVAARANAICVGLRCGKERE